MTENKNNFYKKLSIAVIVIGILLRFALVFSYSIAGDACWQLSASRFLAENRKFPLLENFGRQEPFWAPPLFHMMAAFMYIAFKTFGQNAAELGMKLISPILGSLTLVLVYLISKKLFDERAAFFSVLFTTFIPMFIDYHVFSYIDGTVTFFIVLSIYFALDGRYIKSSIAAGLAALTKYNGIFVMPLLLYITYKNTKEKKLLARKFAVFLIVPVLIASPWFIRNYNDFGNPFWPFFNFVFHGRETGAFESSDLQAFKLGNILSINSITFTYLSIFGVPNGNYSSIMFFNIPYIKVLFAVWLLGTFMFIIPFVKCHKIKEKTTRNILIIWIASFAAVLVLYIGNVGWTAGRFFMPAIPALGILYGNGISRFNFKNKKLRIISFIILAAIITGLVAAEAAKITLASKEWNFYSDDFAWVRQNTKKTDIIIPGYQCLAYYTQRGTLKGTEENLKKADYVFVNQKFSLERRAILDQGLVNELKPSSFEKSYDNKKTGTSIYKSKR